MVRRLTSASSHAFLDRDGFPVGRHRFDRHTLHWISRPGHGRLVRTGPLNTRDKTYRYRVTEATATAEGRPSHEVASKYTRRVSDALAVAVDCYAGYRGEQTPHRFTLADQLVEILAVVERWRTPDHRCFTVRTADETYTLRQDVRSGGWELTEVGRSAPR